MRFDDDDFEEESNSGIPIIFMALGVSVFFLAVLGIVIALNKDNSPKRNDKLVSDFVPVTVSVQSEGAVEIITGSKLVASDLDIWDMYPQEKEEKKKVTPAVTKEAGPTEEVSPSPTEAAEPDDDKHVKVECADGSTDWVEIDDKIEKNNYDFTNLIKSGSKLKYVADGKTASFLGIDISRYQKDIDFLQLKDQGIDFVMIRVGARGYKTGALTMDEYFEKNIDGAIEAGLDVGLYFYSQAISAAEATEEANMVINAIGERKIKYPIAFDMEYVQNDMSRIDTLSKDERTMIAGTFANAIKSAGYTPMIYGNKEWLLKKIDISKFTGSRVWLAQYDDIPDYPYTFDMWQYSIDGEIYGISGNVDMNICLVDYSAQ